MTTHAPSTQTVRRPRRTPLSPSQAGLPDPRPITDYTAAHSVVAGKSRLTITLSQPCVIRSPAWPLIDCTANTLVAPSSVTVVSNTQFYMDFAGVLGPMVAFVQVPPQDPQVQNSQGGFVRSGGQWFRQPVSS